MENRDRYPINVKVGVKPLVIVPEDIARKIGEQPVSREEAQRRGDEAAKELSSELTMDAKFLNPIVIENREDLERLSADLGETDVYWVLGAGRGRTTLILELAHRYLKPLVGGEGVGLSPFLRSKGFEAYPSLNNDLVTLLRVRKAIGLTKGLIVQSRGRRGIGCGCLSSAWDLEDIEARFKMGFDSISDEMFFSEIDRVEQGEAQKLADELIKGAEKTYLDRNYVVKSAKQYLATKSLMDRYGCNALTVACCESVFMDLEMEYETVPCLALVLLNDQGFPASCQGDISAMITMMVLIYISRKSVFMGNIGVPNQGENLISVSHSIPGLRMDGLEAPRLPYSLHSFGVVDFGTAVYVDMLKAQDEGMTIARFDPLVRRLLVTRGELVKSFPVEKGCKQMIHIEIPDAAGFLRRAHTDYGAHFTTVFGDYVQKLKNLAEMIGVEIELM